MKAIANSGLLVQYYIKSGTAFIEGDELVFTAIPPKTRYPLKVIVVACQWGRTIEPHYQTATQVTNEFFIIKNTIVRLKIYNIATTLTGSMFQPISFGESLSRFFSGGWGEVIRRSNGYGSLVGQHYIKN
ncbi:MAG: hypothetical protein ABJB11_19130 [Ferruginibacter sp.]